MGNNPILYSDPFGLDECTIETPEECKIGSFRLGLGLGLEANVKVGVASAGIGASATATVELQATGAGVVSEVDATAQAAAQGQVAGVVSLGGSVSCSAASSDCTESGIEGTIGVDATIGVVRVGFEFNPKDAAIAAGAAIRNGIDLLRRVFGSSQSGADPTLTSNPAHVPRR